MNRDPLQDAFIRRLKAGMAPAMARVGENLANRIRRSIRPGNESGPGQAPASQSGDLRAGITSAVETFDDAVVVAIASADPASLHLELGTRTAAARPFMRPALAEVRKRLPGMLAAQLRRALK